MVLLIKKIYTFGALKDKKLITLKNIEDEIANLIIEKYEDDISSVAIDFNSKENKLIIECK